MMRRLCGVLLILLSAACAALFDMSAFAQVDDAPLLPALNAMHSIESSNAVNQLVSRTDPAQTFAYDADGNLTNGFTASQPGVTGGGVFPFTAVYDVENRLASLTYKDGKNITQAFQYTYSGDGLPAIVKRLENGVVKEETRFVRDGGLIIQERNASNAVTRQYAWGLNLGGGIGGLLNQRRSGKDYAYLYDASGNVEAVLNASQQVVAAYRYDPFGTLLANTGTFDQPFQFSTKRADARIGIVQYEFRNYLPVIGRWMTRDPLGEAGGLNLYAFVGNNPVNWVDPWGLASCNQQQRNFFDDMITPAETVAKEYNFDPNFLLGLSAHESGWLGQHGRDLNNAFGLTQAGGKNLTFEHISTSVDYWGEHYGGKVRDATSIDDFIKKLLVDLRSQGGLGPYNSVDPEWGKKIKDAYKSIVRRRGDPSCEPVKTPTTCGAR
ncbi:YD repeat protein [Candidatus Moduliflexus flocculans]|uniref:YD repeat protein n=1 Tax=Candidatus Moduliflexus flocculans TaxID=1499966 RepID=A0A0S6VS73_9BACT|nr:YD repeat protein [Candidatus Moduliflexus flocculans]